MRQSVLGIFEASEAAGGHKHGQTDWSRNGAAAQVCDCHLCHLPPCLHAYTAHQLRSCSLLADRFSVSVEGWQKTNLVVDSSACTFPLLTTCSERDMIEQFVNPAMKAHGWPLAKVHATDGFTSCNARNRPRQGASSLSV